MLLNDQRERRRQHFLARHITRGCGFGFRPNILGDFSRFGEGTPMLLRFGQVAGFASVPQPGTGPQKRSAGGGREREHANQQQHDAGRKNEPIECNDSVHACILDAPGTG